MAIHPSYILFDHLCSTVDVGFQPRKDVNNVLIALLVEFKTRMNADKQNVPPFTLPTQKSELTTYIENFYKHCSESFIENVSPQEYMERAYFDQKVSTPIDAIVIDGKIQTGHTLEYFRNKYIESISDNYDNTLASTSYQNWKNGNPHMLMADEIYLFRHIKMIETVLVPLIQGTSTSTSMIGKAKSAANAFTGMFKPKSNSSGGKMSRRNRRNMSQRRGGSSLRRKKNVRRTHRRRRHTRSNK